MMKIFSFFLLLTIVKAQVFFPGEKTESPDPAPEEVHEAVDKELFEKVEVDIRHGGNPFSSSSCVTPDGKTGMCRSFSSCSAYTGMRNRLSDPRVLTFLRARICRHLSQIVLLCCPTLNAAPSHPSIDSSSPSRLSQQECGSVPLANRIVGGTVTEPGEWPWMAALGTKFGNFFSQSCAGTLITPRHVLTAGHCFLPGTNFPTMVRLGAYDLTKSSTTIPPQDINIRSRRNGGYNKNNHENDIEMLILEHEAAINDYVQLACLPFNYQNKDFLGEELIVTGWGRTHFTSSRNSNIPLKALVPVKDTQSCATSYQKVEESGRPVIDRRSLCAGDGSTDSCGGDSGGPLHYLDLKKGKYYLVGIVSFGIGCANSEYPGVYTRVTSFLDWIEANAS